MYAILNKRNDVAELFLDIIRPLRPFYSQHHAFLCVGNTGVHYGEKAARMEGFARVLWGLTPLWSADNTKLPAKAQEEIEEWKAWYKEGIIHGTTPDDEEYWGDMFDFDQKMVEAPAIAFTLALNPKAFWEDLNDQEKENLYNWLNQINDYDMPKSNWRCFRILTNVALRLLGLAWSEERTEEDFGILENCYLADGWYFDGNPGQMDYYVASAIHHYGLLYSKLIGDLDKERCRIFKERGTEFFHDFVYWFANDGTEIPFGRSLTYRFSHSGPFAAMAYADLDLDYGVLKNLLLGNLESWVKKPIFDNVGVLTIGYGYPNLIMAENYNGCGSPYWGMKPFLVLGLDDDHPFWTAERKPYPYESKKFLKYPHMLITHDDHDHVMAYITGQHCMGDHGQSAAKYEKFVYSNQFGFSVSRGDSLEAGAFDSTLAVSRKGENRYCMRYGMTDFAASEDMLSASYNPMNGVAVKSTVVPCGPWHVRIHEIENQEAIEIADGGFALPRERCFQVTEGPKMGLFEKEDVQTTQHSLTAGFPWGTSCIVSETGYSPELIVPFSNTNLFYNLTVIPTVKAVLEPGTHVVVTSVAADFHEDGENLMKRKPAVEVGEHEVKIVCDGQSVTVPLK